MFLHPDPEIQRLLENMFDHVETRRESIRDLQRMGIEFPASRAGWWAIDAGESGAFWVRVLDGAWIVPWHLHTGEDGEPAWVPVDVREQPQIEFRGATPEEAAALYDERVPPFLMPGSSQVLQWLALWRSRLTGETHRESLDLLFPKARDRLALPDWLVDDEELSPAEAERIEKLAERVLERRRDRSRAEQLRRFLAGNEEVAHGEE